MAQGRNKKFENFLEKISQGNGEMTDLLITHEAALTANLDDLFTVVNTANKTKQNFIDVLANIPGAGAGDNGISEKGKAELAAQLFGAYQVNRIRNENDDDKVISDLLEREEECTPILSALVKHFGSLHDSDAVNTIFNHLEGGDLQNAIDDIPGLTENDETNLVKAFFGKNQYNEMLRVLRDEGNHDILIAQLEMHKHKTDIKQQLAGAEDQAQVTALINNLINTNNDKAQTLAAMKALGMKDPGDVGILNDARDAIYGENQYRRIRATPPQQIYEENLPNDNVLLDQLAHRKAEVCRLLGQKNDSNEIDFLVNAVKNVNVNKDQILVEMNLIGLDGNTPDNVNQIFGENQYRKLCITEIDPLLAGLIRARPAAMKNALANVADVNAIDDINGIDNLVENLSNSAKTKAEIGADMVTLGLVDAVDADAVNARYGAVQYEALPQTFKALCGGRENDVQTALGAHPETDTREKIKGLRAALSDATKTKAEIGEMMIILGIVAGPYNAANEVISHYYGELQYNRVIAMNHPENPALDVQLRSADRKNHVIAKLGAKHNADEVDGLISDVTENSYTKSAVRNNMDDLGLDPDKVNAIYGENKYNFYLTDIDIIAYHPAFHAQLQLPGQKNNIINTLGDADSVSTLVKAVTNKKSDKADIANAMTAVGLNAAVPANVDAVFGENQYLRIFDEAYANRNAQLKSLLVDNGAAPLIKNKLGKKNTIAEVDALVTAIKKADIETLPAKLQDLFGVLNVSPVVAKSIFIDTQYSRILNDAIASGNGPLTNALEDNTVAVKTKLGEAATFDAVNALIKNIQSADKAGLVAALAALDIPAPADPGAFFVDTQYSRIRAEAKAKGNTVFVAGLEDKSASVKVKLQSLNSAKDVDVLVNAIFDAGRVELRLALQALGIAPPHDIDALLGEVRHNSLLFGAEKESNPALFQALKVNAPRVKDVLAPLATTEDTDRLIDAINNVDKPDLTAALNALGITEIPNLNGIFGETQYARMIADNAVLPDPSALRTLMSDDANKETLKKYLGSLPDKTICDDFIKVLQNKEMERNQIKTILTTAGFDDTASSAAAKTLYAENQYKRVQAVEYANHATLSALIKSADGKTALTKTFQHDALATIKQVDAMLDRLQSVNTKKDVTHALTSMGLTPTPEQIDAIVQENRKAAHEAADKFDPAQPKPPALAEFNDLSPNMGSLNKQLARAEAMQTFVKTALHSRTALTDAASLETIDNTVQKSIIYLKACAKQCDHDIANPGGHDVTELNNRKLEIEKALALFQEIEASLRMYINSDKAAGPQNIAVIGQAGAVGTVHDQVDDPKNPSYLQAYRELDQFFGGAAAGGGASMVLPAPNQPTPKWDAGVSRSVTNEIDFDYKQAVTGKVIPASVKTGVIQTEVKQYVDGPSSYRQDFFFEPKGEAKMRKGERQFAPPHKTPNIPADHVMQWANDAVRNFMAFADTKDKLITINAGAMPKCCLEALAIVSEAHGLRYVMKGAILGMDAKEREAKVALTKKIYGTQLQTAQEVTSDNIVPPRPGRS